MLRFSRMTRTATLAPLAALPCSAPIWVLAPVRRLAVALRLPVLAAGLAWLARTVTRAALRLRPDWLAVALRLALAVLALAVLAVVSARLTLQRTAARG